MTSAAKTWIRACSSHLPECFSAAMAGVERWGSGEREIWTLLWVCSLKVNLHFKLHNLPACRKRQHPAPITVLGFLQLVWVKIISHENLLGFFWSTFQTFCISEFIQTRAWYVTEWQWLWIPAESLTSSFHTSRFPSFLLFPFAFHYTGGVVHHGSDIWHVND